jgi:hypothetical protein
LGAAKLQKKAPNALKSLARCRMLARVPAGG